MTNTDDSSRAAEAASKELVPLPRCGTCGVSFVLRPGFDGTGNGYTREQRWCGVWYDHPPVGPEGHTSVASVLFESPALKQELARQRAAIAAAGKTSSSKRPRRRSRRGNGVGRVAASD